MEEGPEFKMVAENWERILYSRLSMTENSLPTMPGLFDYLTIAWLKINVRLENIAKLVADPEIAQVATKRCEKLKQFAGLVMNYVGLVINPDMIDMFPQNHQYTKSLSNNFNFVIDMVRDTLELAYWNALIRNLFILDISLKNLFPDLPMKAYKRWIWWFLMINFFRFSLPPSRVF